MAQWHTHTPQHMATPPTRCRGLANSASKQVSLSSLLGASWGKAEGSGALPYREDRTDLQGSMMVWIKEGRRSSYSFQLQPPQ